MNPDANSQTAHELLRQAQVAYYNDADDKTCARLLWEATFSSMQQLAAQMGHPCQDQAQAKEFALYLEREHGGKVLHAYSMLFFGLTMLEHAEETELALDPEFAWTFPEFPLAIREVSRIVESLTTYDKSAMH